MQGQIERLLPLLANWGAPGLAALLVATLVVIGRLGWRRAFLVPARWPARVAALGLLALAGVGAAGLCVVTGPMRPVLGQVRYVESIVNHPAAEAEFREVATDTPRRLSGLRGKVVVLNLWATWCGPCRGELPAINRLQKAYAARGLVVVTLSTEERDHLRAFAVQHPLGTLNVYAPRIDWLDIPGRPLSLVIDRDGVVRNCFIGARSYGEFERAVTRRLGTAS